MITLDSAMLNRFITKLPVFFYRLGQVFQSFFGGTDDYSPLSPCPNFLSSTLDLNEIELLLLLHLCITYKDSNNYRNILHIVKEPRQQEHEKGHKYNDREIDQ